MSKAEELAKELFPLLETDKIGNNPYITYNTEQLAKREGYIKGFLQAEEDLELSWEDMFTIFHLVNEVLDDYAEGKTKKEVGEEVLRRFKERR